MARFIDAFAALFALLLLSSALAAGAPQEIDDIETLKESIDSLRANDRYFDAIAMARKLVGAIRADSCSYRHEIDDAARLLATLEEIARMPDEARAELGRAVRLQADCARLEDEGDIGSAARLAERRLEIMKRYLGSMQYETARSLDDLGYYLNDLGEVERAEQLFLESIDVLERSVGEMHPDVASIYSNLGVLSKRKSDFASAEAFYRRAIVIYRSVDQSACGAGGYASDIVYTLRMLGALFVARGSDELAEPILQEAATILRSSGDSTELALTMMDLASLYQDREFWGTAETLYRDALSLLQDSTSLTAGTPREENEYLWAALNNLGDLEHDMGNYATADSLYVEALRVKALVVPEIPEDTAVILLNRARNYRDWGTYEAALPLYEKARTILENRLGKDHPHLSRCEFSTANLHFAKGEYRRAEALFLDAARIYELTRAHIGSGMERITFQNSPYPKLAATYLSLNEAEKSWPAMERYLGRYLGDLLSITDTRELDAAERSREDSLKYAVRELQSALMALRDEAGRDESKAVLERTDSVRLRLETAEAALASWETEIASRHPLSEGQPYSLDHVQSMIPAGSAMVGWLDVEAAKGTCPSWAYVIRRSGPVSWLQVGPEKGTRTECGSRRSEAFRQAISRPRVTSGTGTDLAREIWLARFAPLERALAGISRLIIIPSGPMLGIPVEALVDSAGVPLGDRFSISYAPSATVYAWLVESSQKRPPGGRKSILLCGDPIFGAPPADSSSAARGASRDADSRGQWQPLPGTRKELEAISACAPRSLTLVGLDASEQRLRRFATADTLRSFGILHFATHAFVDDRYPERCALVFSQVNLPDALECARRGDRIFDGLVDAGEILREWKLDADLVTLSACETGAGRSLPGEGYIGFSHAFFRAGALSLIVSMWKADDRATALLMQRFYEIYLGENTVVRAPTRRMSKVEALQRAKQWLRSYRDSSGRRPFEHPFYWANFILIGDPGEAR